MSDSLFLECEDCTKLDNGMRLYSINTVKKYEVYALKYMKAHKLKYHTKKDSNV